MGQPSCYCIEAIVLVTIVNTASDWDPDQNNWHWQWKVDARPPHEEQQRVLFHIHFKSSWAASLIPSHFQSQGLSSLSWASMTELSPLPSRRACIKPRCPELAPSTRPSCHSPGMPDHCGSRDKNPESSISNALIYKNSLTSTATWLTWKTQDENIPFN